MHQFERRLTPSTYFSVHTMSHFFRSIQMQTVISFCSWWWWSSGHTPLRYRSYVSHSTKDIGIVPCIYLSLCVHDNRFVQKRPVVERKKDQSRIYIVLWPFIIIKINCAATIVCLFFYSTQQMVFGTKTKKGKSVAEFFFFFRNEVFLSYRIVSYIWNVGISTGTWYA